MIGCELPVEKKLFKKAFEIASSLKNPEDLNSIYSNVDIVVACYEAENLNERIAEPNKLYEAMFFCKPIIVSKDTFLANQVNENKFGWVVDAYNDAEIIEFVKNILPPFSIDSHIVKNQDGLFLFYSMVSISLRALMVNCHVPLYTVSMPVTFSFPSGIMLVAKLA